MRKECGSPRQCRLASLTGKKPLQNPIMDPNGLFQTYPRKCSVFVSGFSSLRDAIDPINLRIINPKNFKMRGPCLFLISLAILPFCSISRDLVRGGKKKLNNRPRFLVSKSMPTKRMINLLEEERSSPSQKTCS